MESSFRGDDVREWAVPAHDEVVPPDLDRFIQWVSETMASALGPEWAGQK